MKISVSIKQPNHFIRKVCTLLKERGQGEECGALLNGQFDGEVVRFADLSTAQFCALEDTAVRLGLQYDGTQ